MSTTIFNPLAHIPDAVESSSSDMESNSKILCNDQADKCPKCGSKMAVKSISTGEAMYCGKCRVTNPMPV